MASAARSSGRTVRIFPFGALPTGVRAAAATNASLIISIPQWFSGFQRVFDALDGFGFPAQTQERFPFQIHNVLLGYEVQRSQIAATQNVGELRAHLLVVFADLAG